jgi:hypothetical protein
MIRLEDYGRPPREGEVVCHNHVLHKARTPSGVNGFRWWSEAAPPPHFEPCPCGWRAELGTHYASHGHVASWREKIAKHGSLRAVYRTFSMRQP